MRSYTVRDNIVSVSSSEALEDKILLIEVVKALEQLGIYNIEIKLLKEPEHNCLIVRDLDILRVNRNKRDRVDKG